jgi:hypothetical protein
MPEIPQIDRLIAEVAVRHGILLKKDDAAFALVTLNQLVLESAIGDLATQMRTATSEFESAMERVQEKAGIAVAKQVKATVQELSEGLGPAGEATRGSPNPEPSALPWSVLAAFAVGLAVGMLVARLL